MLDLLRLIWCLVIGLFRSRAALQAEILVLRHQLNVLRRKSPKRLVFNNIDRLVFAVGRCYGQKKKAAARTILRNEPKMVCCTEFVVRPRYRSDADLCRREFGGRAASAEKNF